MAGPMQKVLLMSVVLMSFLVESSVGIDTRMQERVNHLIDIINEGVLYFGHNKMPVYKTGQYPTASEGLKISIVFDGYINNIRTAMRCYKGKMISQNQINGTICLDKPVIDGQYSISIPKTGAAPAASYRGWIRVRAHKVFCDFSVAVDGKLIPTSLIYIDDKKTKWLQILNISGLSGKYTEVFKSALKATLGQILGGLCVEPIGKIIKHKLIPMYKT